MGILKIWKAEGVFWCIYFSEWSWQFLTACKSPRNRKISGFQQERKKSINLLLVYRNKHQFTLLITGCLNGILKAAYFCVPGRNVFPGAVYEENGKWKMCWPALLRLWFSFFFFLILLVLSIMVSLNVFLVNMLHFKGGLCFCL